MILGIDGLRPIAAWQGRMHASAANTLSRPNTNEKLTAGFELHQLQTRFVCNDTVSMDRTRFVATIAIYFGLDPASG
jgi:hypothetical protein